MNFSDDEAEAKPVNTGYAADSSSPDMGTALSLTLAALGADGPAEEAKAEEDDTPLFDLNQPLLYSQEAATPCPELFSDFENAFTKA